MLKDLLGPIATIGAVDFSCLADGLLSAGMAGAVANAALVANNEPIANNVIIFIYPPLLGIPVSANIGNPDKIVLARLTISHQIMRNVDATPYDECRISTDELHEIARWRWLQNAHYFSVWGINRRSEDKDSVFAQRLTKARS